MPIGYEVLARLSQLIHVLAGRQKAFISRPMSANTGKCWGENDGTNARNYGDHKTDREAPYSRRPSGVVHNAAQPRGSLMYVPHTCVNLRHGPSYW